MTDVTPVNLLDSSLGLWPWAALTKHRGGGLPACRVTFVPQCSVPSTVVPLLGDLLPKSMASLCHTNFQKVPYKLFHRLFTPFQSLFWVAVHTKCTSSAHCVPRVHIHYGPNTVSMYHLRTNPVPFTRTFTLAQSLTSPPVSSTVKVEVIHNHTLS